jgi:hypothetical protein
LPNARAPDALLATSGYNLAVATRNAVQRAFDAYGKAAFHQKRSGTWHRQAGAVEQSLNLQKSQHSLRYYLNVDLAFATEGGRGRIVGRAERLLSPSDRAQLDALLDVAGTEMRRSTVSTNCSESSHDRQGTFAAMGVTGPARDTFDQR